MITFGVIVNKQNNAYSSIKTNPPVFLEIKEETNKDYIAVNPPSPFALVPTAANFSAPGYPANIPPIPSINSLPNMPDMPLSPGLHPDMAFGNSLYIKAIIYSKNKNNIAILSNGQNDIAVSVGQETEWGRFRVNAYRQRGSIALAIRVVHESVPSLEELGHLEILKTLANKPHGLVLVTGSAGSGKSTTLAAILNYINEERHAHIITLEDPIEYLHKHKKSIVNQREIGSDSASFASALRATLREDPNIIMVGEMRDSETISTAITAAETGHLVLASLHTGDTTQAVDRIIDSFAPHQQQQVRSQLALSLQGVIAQQLVPRKDGSGRICAVEVLLVNPAIANLIREGRNHQIYATIQTNSNIGMQTMDMSLRELLKKGLVSYEEASRRIINREMIQQMKKD